jgi:hypothetical protein
MMNINLQLHRVEITRPYSDVVTSFEQIVPKIDQARLDELVDTGAGAQAITAAIEDMMGDSHLTRFYRIRAGDLFSALEHTRVESVKYLVGNALIAQRLFSHALTAGLHVPFVLNFYGQEGKTTMEYFMPSSFLAHVSANSEVTMIGLKLDNLMSDLVRKLGES